MALSAVVVECTIATGKQERPKGMTEPEDGSHEEAS